MAGQQRAEQGGHLMRRRVAILMAIALIAELSCAAQASTAAEPPVCIQIDPATGQCTVHSGGGGSGGGGGDHGGGGTGGGGGDTSCHWDTSNGHAPGVVPCSENGAVWNGFCYLSLMTPQPPIGIDGGGVWGDHTDGAIYICSAAGPGESPIGIVGVEFWFATPPPGLGPSPEQLAQQALKTLTILPPVPGRYPAGTLKDGRPYTVVNAYTWYWTSADSFKIQTATASARGLSSTVMVAPSTLTFNPGDGSQGVSCAGPGTQWQKGNGVWAASPSGCDFRYPHSSIHEPNGEVTATYGIDWKITWTASDGENGTLPDITTTAKSTFAVAEVESVVTH
jgi:hypothetical protein